MFECLCKKNIYGVVIYDKTDEKPFIYTFFHLINPSDGFLVHFTFLFCELFIDSVQYVPGTYLMCK